MKRNRKERNNRFALSFMFALATFGVLLISGVVASILVYFLARFSLLPGEGAPEIGWILLFTAFICTVVGTVLSMFVMKLPLKPVNRLITQLNRLADGDFKARLHFGKPLQSHPSFQEAERSFNKMAEELEQTELLRSDFINNFSHEFKTPIVSIAGFAKLLKRERLSEEQRREYIGIIEEESLRLAAMATNVLNLTKVENQQILAEVSHYNLSEQLRSAVLLLEDKWARKNLEFDLEFGEYGIEANEELLKQVWINLLDNAIKFSPEGGLVAVNVEEKEKSLAVSIENRGRPIAEEDLKKIFNKFYQADESHAAEGNGVGLAIVRRVVKLHGGTVRAENGENSVRFTVTLPKKQKSLSD